MLMLTIETFLLLLLSGLLGLVVGQLFACESGCGGVGWSDDRPWLRDVRAMPVAPTLPTAPALLDARERDRLAASLSEAKSAGTTADVIADAATAKAAEDAAAKAAADAAAAKAAEDAAAKAAADAAAARAAEDAAAKAAADAAAAKAAEDAAAEAAADAAAAKAAEDAAAKAAADAAAAKAAEDAAAKAAADAAAAQAAEAAAAADYVLPAELAAAAVTPTVAPEDAERAAAADAVGTRPMALATPMGGKADDLKRVRGIGPANEKKLNGLGVYHFSQIAAWTAENAKWAGSFMAFPGRIEREDWIAQAKILATGAETAFSKRVDAGEVPTSKS